MQTDTQTNKKEYNPDDFIDLGEIAEDYLRCLKKYWLQFLLLLILAAAVTVSYRNWSYTPEYLGKITYAVNKTSDTSVNAYIAKSLSSAVPALTATAEFQEDVFEKVDKDSINRNYTIASTYTEGANLFTLSVSSNNYKNTNLILDALEAVYPEWASRSNGTVELQTVDKSEASDAPTNPYSLMQSLLMGLAVGLALCFVLATWYALTVKTVRKESDMRRITGKGCISLIPEVKPKKRGKSKKEQLLIDKKRIDWGFKQSLLAAQSRMEKQMEQNGEKVLLITSTLPQEGKSMVTANLALAFAKQDKKVLILDGDLRNPSIGKVLGMEGEGKGLTDFFERKADLKEIVKQKNGIDMIGGGSKKGEVSALIPEPKMRDLMSCLRGMYDVILIDTPPAQLFTDAALLEKYADCAVYVVRHDMAEMKEIKEGIAPFIRNEKLLGYIINRNPGGFSTYGKYGYSKYGHYGKYKRYINLDESSLNTEDTL